MDQYVLGVVTGAGVSLVTQLFTTVVLKPVHDLRELIGEVAAALINYANIYGTFASDERKKEAQVTFRRQASNLRAKAYGAFLTGLWSLGLIPRRSNLVQASRHLIALSNYATAVTAASPASEGSRVTEEASKLEQQIATLLRISLEED